MGRFPGTLGDLDQIRVGFYGQFNTIMSVLGKQSEMSAMYLIKTYCLSTYLNVRLRGMDLD